MLQFRSTATTGTFLQVWRYISRSVRWHMLGMQMLYARYERDGMQVAAAASNAQIAEWLRALAQGTEHACDSWGEYQRSRLYSAIEQELRFCVQYEARDIELRDRIAELFKLRASL